MLLQRQALRLRQVRPVQAGIAVDVLGDVRLADDRPVRSGRDRDLRPPANSRMRIAFAVVFSSVWLPATVVTPRSSTSGLASARSSAIASS